MALLASVLFLCAVTTLLSGVVAQSPPPAAAYLPSYNRDVLDMDGNKFTRVESYDDLWRFQVSSTDLNKVNIGSGAVCLYTLFGTFVAVSESGLSATSEQCESDERFEIEVFDGGVVTIRSLMSKLYVSCAVDWTLGVAETPGEQELFVMYVDEKGGRFGLYAITKQRWVAFRANGDMACDALTLDNTEEFIGWKGGPKAAWQPYDDGLLVYTYINTFSPDPIVVAAPRLLGYEISETGFANLNVPRELASPGSEVKAMFEDPGFVSMVALPWVIVVPEVWEPAELGYCKYALEAHQELNVFQTVGYVGPWAFYTNYGNSGIGVMLNLTWPLGEPDASVKLQTTVPLARFAKV